MKPKTVHLQYCKAKPRCIQGSIGDIKGCLRYSHTHNTLLIR